MTNKMKNKQTTTDGLPALRIGSRVRCSDDGVEGRITWANGVSVKIQWNDGEQVTWRRDSLSGRPIEILDRAGEEEQNSTATATVEEAQSIPTEEPPTELAATSSASEVVSTAATLSETEPSPIAETPPLLQPVPEQTALSVVDGAAEVSVPKRRRKEPASPKAKKLSALDAAARVLLESGQAMTCQEMIVIMAAKDYWKSPGGKTPAATLYSAILKETTTKGTNSRFVKAERGKFALSAPV